MRPAERIARAFHEVYETAARIHGWSTQEASRTDFDDLPPENKATMISTVQGLLDGGVIAIGGFSSHVAKAEKMADQRTEEMLEVSAKAQRLHEDLVSAQGRVRMAEARLKNVRGFHDLVLKALEEARGKLGHSRKRASETGVTDPITKYWEGRESALREMRNRLGGVLNGAILTRTPVKLPTNPLIGKGVRVRPNSPSPGRNWCGTVLFDRDSADRVHVRVDEDDVDRVGFREAMLKVTDLTWVGYGIAGARGLKATDLIIDEADEASEPTSDAFMYENRIQSRHGNSESEKDPPDPRIRKGARVWYDDGSPDGWRGTVLADPDSIGRVPVDIDNKGNENYHSGESAPVFFAEELECIDPGPPQTDRYERFLSQLGIAQEKFELTPAQINFFERLGDTVKQIGSRERAEVERRILNGENDITVMSGRYKVRYIIPSPWRHPIRRLRIAIARARHSWRVG